MTKYYLWHLFFALLPMANVHSGWQLVHTLTPPSAGNGVSVNDLAFGRGTVPNNYLIAAHGFLPVTRPPHTAAEGSVGLWNVDTGAELQRYTKSVSNMDFNAVRSVDWDPAEPAPYKFVVATSIVNIDTPFAHALIFNSSGTSIADLRLVNDTTLGSVCTSAMYHPYLPLIVAVEGSGALGRQITLWDAASTGASPAYLSSMTHTTENQSTSNPVWTARFIDEGIYRDHIVVTSMAEMSPRLGSVSLWDIIDPTVPMQDPSSPMDIEGGVNAFTEPATVLFTQTFGTTNLMVNANDTIASFIGHTSLIDSLPFGNKFTSKLTIQTPLRNYSAKPIATCVLKNPSSCTVTGDQLGIIYVGFSNGDIGYQSSCDLISADTPFNFITGAHPGYTVGWADAYGTGNTGYLVTVAGGGDPVTGEVKIWKLDSNGAPTLEKTITRPGIQMFAQVAKFQPDTNTLAIGYRDGIIEIWKLL